jgi:hypothetical protein
MGLRVCVAVMASFGLVACSPSLCDRDGVCPNDPIPTPADRNACRSVQDANLNSKCFAETQGYASCAAPMEGRMPRWRRQR